MKTRVRIFLTIILTAIVTFAVTLVWIYGGKNKNVFGFKLDDTNVATAISTDAVQAKLKLIKTKIGESYLDVANLNEKQMMEYMIKGYVAGIGDPYTGYFTPEEMSELSTKTEGEYAGIGVYMTANMKENKVQILSILQDSPAEKADLHPGDYIISVNGIPVTVEQYEAIPDMIKGKIGSKVTLVIERNGEEKTFEMEVATVQLSQVESKMLDSKIGYISLKSFEGNSYNQFKRAYENLLVNGAEMLIVDIRNNMGGVLDECANIVDMFVDKDNVILTEKNNKGAEKEVKTVKEKTITMPVVLLVNQYSASASEVTAAALKEYADNVTVMGNRTYGKGVIQVLYELSDGSGLKVTIEEYFGPNHSKINGEGVAPDIELESYKYTGELQDDDPQIQRAMEELKK